jgi:hypothetical protein
MSVGLKWACAAGSLVVTVWSAEHGLAMAATPGSSVTRSVVVAELFTSEGCSSCPPADDVLSQFGRQPASDVEVLALGEHVDYWDRLDWQPANVRGREFSAGTWESPHRRRRVLQTWSSGSPTSGRMNTLANVVPDPLSRTALINEHSFSRRDQ